MHFIFGYQREVPVKIERETSKIILFGIAILVVFLFLFLTFEDLDEDNFITPPSFNIASCSAKVGTQVKMANKFEIGSEIRLVQDFWRSELRNLSRFYWDWQSQFR
jgi:hypothetical protein